MSARLASGLWILVCAVPALLGATAAAAVSATPDPGGVPGPRGVLPGAGTRPRADTGAKSNHYELEVTLDPAIGTIAVTGTLAVVADSPRTAVSLLLNGGLAVRAIDGRDVAGVAVTRGTALGSLPLPTTQRVSVRLARPLQRGDTAILRLSYAGRLDPASFEFGRGLVSERWTELSVGALWYPLLNDEPEVTARVRLSLPPGYQVVAPGAVRRLDARRWELNMDRTERHRVGFAVGKGWHVTSRSLTMGRRMTMYAARPDPRVGRALDAAVAAYAALERWYGPPVGARTDLAVLYPNDSLGLRYPNGAYSTGGTLIALDDNADQTAWLDTFHHELAHLWWTTGRPGTADEFLSESLAEYHALRIGRAAFGGPWLERQRAALARRSAGAAGSLRTVRGAYAAELSPLLYSRGPTALWALSDRVGEAALTAHLRATRERRVDTLAEFLAVLAEREGDQVARWFAARL